jgi:hypothetical protein
VAKFITFNGVTLVHPGGLTKIDADGMAQVGGGVSGVVGVIGEADYGQPYNPTTAAADGVEPKVYQFTDPQSMSDTFKSGPLADAVDFLFNPSNDVRIPGGVQRVIALKSNLDTQSSAVAQNVVGDAVACTLKSVVYGKNTNSIALTTSVNAADGNTIDVSIVDGSTSTTETFTQVAGEALLDVQYAPSQPVQVGTNYTTTGAGGNSQLVVAGLTAEDEGRWVRIVSSPAGVVPAGTTRRIANGGIAGSNIDVEGAFFNSVGAATTPGTGTVFQVLREAPGPFFVNAYNSATTTITVNARSDQQPTGYVAGAPLFWTDGTGDGAYGSPLTGPCYVHIVSGTGAGQIRRIVTSGAVSAAASTGIAVINGFATNPDNTSQFVFINAVPKHTAGMPDAPTATDGNAMGEGALGVVAGASGLATTLTLQVRPGWGEPATHGGASVNHVAAGPVRPADWTWGLSGTLNANALVSAINLGNVISGASKGSDTTVGAWKSRVGLGRNGLLTTDRLDFSGRANGAFLAAAGIDCLCDFDTTNTSGLGTYNATPNRYHRFVDNLAQLVDTVNAQSALVVATRAIVAGSAPYTGANFGDGVPAFATFPLANGTYTETTSTSLRDCFDELIRHRHNTCVPLWSESTTEFSIDYVHSLIQTNVKRGAGVYKNEIDGIASFRPAIGNAGVALAAIKSQATTLNSRNVALVFQDIKRPGLDGKVNQYAPHMLGCAIAGMQAGATVGTPLTYKLVKANSILCRDTKVDVLDRTTSDDLLLSGTLFTEFVRGQGYRIVRNLSTYTATDNLAYTDRHVNYELNYMAYDLRTLIEERFVGVKATPGTVGSIRSAVISKLEYYKGNLEIIVDSQDIATGAILNAYRNLKITISGDICTIRFEIFPTVGINYITFEIFAQLPTLSA